MVPLFDIGVGRLYVLEGVYHECIVAQRDRLRPSSRARSEQKNGCIVIGNLRYHLIRGLPLQSVLHSYPFRFLQLK